MCANEIQRDYGNPNHNAPHELSQFGFLIGKWRCDVQTVAEDGALATFKAIWLGRYILDGYVIADEYRMMDRSGQLVMLGSNYRSYNVKTNTWVMKWHEAALGCAQDSGTRRSSQSDPSVSQLKNRR